MTVIVRFEFRDAETFRTRYTEQAFEANMHLLSFLSRNGVVTVEPDTGRNDIVDITTNRDDFDIFDGGQNE